LLHKVKLPKLGETVDTVVIREWHCSVGDQVEQNQLLLTVETDKVEAEVPAPISGKVVELLVELEDEVATGAPICILEN
jgi:pyruvate/2-oxoglutarate dehydrogenase complex dihydrolipoamide acyltransferase (E2) component